MSVVRTLFALAMGSLLLAGCSNSPDEPISRSAPPPPPPSAPAFEPLAWGQTYTYADGSTMSVAEPTEWSSPEDCEIYGAEYCEPMVRVSFTFGNGTPVPQLDSLGTMNAFVQIDHGLAQEVVVDTYNTEGLNTFPSGPLMPGAPGTQDLVFVAPVGEAVMTAGWTHLGETAIFEGPVANGTTEEPAPVAKPGVMTADDCDALADDLIALELPNADMTPMLRDAGCGEWIDAREDAAADAAESAEHEYPAYSCDMAADGTPICEGDVPKSIGHETPDSVPSFEECLAQAEESAASGGDGYPSRQCQDLYRDRAE